MNHWRTRYSEDRSIGSLIAVLAICCVCALVINCGKEKHHHHETMSGGTASGGSLYDLSLNFVDAAGKERALRSLQGAPVVLSMIYTRCQSICPTLAGNMLSIQKGLKPNDRTRTRFVLVSFDSGDSSADLAQFAQKLKMDEHWTLLRGAEGDVRQLSAAIGFQYRRSPDGVFAHSATTYILNAKGEVVFRKDGTVGAPDEFREKLSSL